MSKNGDAEEEDYMSMAIPEPVQPMKETSVQRRARKEREGREKGQLKSKKELEVEATLTREAGLTQTLPASNKGAQMMAKLGYKPGSTLGKHTDARTEPINVVIKEDRGGIGLESEKKRKFREEAEREAKRVKAEKEGEGGYKERMRREREERKLGGQVIGAMKVAERLDLEAEEEGLAEKAFAPGKTHREGEKGDMADSERDWPQKAANGISVESVRSKPTKSINILWRGLVRHRLQTERERRMRHDLEQSLSRNPTYDDPEANADDKLAFGDEEVELEEDDPDLDAFDALPPEERLGKLVVYLRERYRYCFWCKFRYLDEAMEGCPGTTEDDHD